MMTSLKTEVTLSTRSAELVCSTTSEISIVEIGEELVVQVSGRRLGTHPLEADRIAFYFKEWNENLRAALHTYIEENCQELDLKSLAQFCGSLSHYNLHF